MRWLLRLYIWATYRLYDEFAWAYDLVSWVVSLGQWSRWRRSALEHVVGRRVLELGFGTGELLLEMGRRGWRAAGLDSSPAMHRVTARKMARRGVWVPRVRALAQRMPFADTSFDSIVATFPANYIVDPATLREVARLLRPGGRFVVVGLSATTECRLLRRAVHLLFGVPVERILAHYHKIAQAAGLQVTLTTEGGGFFKVPAAVAERPQGTDPAGASRRLGGGCAGLASSDHEERRSV